MKKRYLVCMKFGCASNAAIKNVQIARKIFLTKSPFFQKVQIFKINKIYFRILEVLPVILTTYLGPTCLGLTIKIQINYLQHHVKFTKKL